ncbi:hypothetical protein [Streptomyces sp. NPDC048111]|uniref:hypothetical protein n=1 Tax=Streptomyces sp. NPDC048111 TaxID=3365500 RepID=UPI003715542B
MAIPNLPPVVPQACPLCAGALESVELRMTNAPNSHFVVKFFRPDKMFASKSYVTALGCRECGHLLLFMEDRGILAPGK